jgi:BlaI family penicillinase repressor
MYKLTEAEWSVLQVLWKGKHFSLGEVVEALRPVTRWSRIYRSYLSDPYGKQGVCIDRPNQRSASLCAEVSREDCARAERSVLLNKVYGGAVGDLVSAFLKESSIHAAGERAAPEATGRYGGLIMTNIWGFLVQTFSVSLVAALLLVVKELLADSSRHAGSMGSGVCWHYGLFCR